MNVAIVGYGIEGRASYAYWKKKGDNVTIVDQKSGITHVPGDAQTILGKDALKNLGEFDMVIRTPQMNPNVLRETKKVWSATNEFFQHCPAPIIGVTGTKGKGTTCSLIAAMLEQAGKTVHLLGNIGRPALGVLPIIHSQDIVVFELSSFQLWDLEYSPHIAMVLMIDNDHLDVHADMNDYVLAKSNIARHQNENDVLIYHPTNQLSKQIADCSPARKLRYMNDEGAHLKNDEIIIDEQSICLVKDIKLIGKHNVENVCAAVTAAWRYSKDTAAIRRAIQQFSGLPHRLEFVRSVKGVDYYNDSYSSTPAATIAAISTFEQSITLVVGGQDKHGDFHKLAEQISQNQNVDNVVIYGAVRHKIKDALKNIKTAAIQVIDSVSLHDIVAAAQEVSQPGSVVIFSPGASSFDMFKNFNDRGEQFKDVVEALS
jgi:UDP-N-acetylmuramoylalanine--D-glutamate ligase